MFYVGNLEYDNFFLNIHSLQKLAILKINVFKNILH